MKVIIKVIGCYITKWYQVADEMFRHAFEKTNYDKSSSFGGEADQTRSKT